jgi:superfamily II DNA helicase RecQ
MYLSSPLSGRAGRDGLKAECTMYVSEGDFDKYKSEFYLGKLTGPSKEAVLQSISSLKSYSLDSIKCRRKALLEFFSETPSFGNRCGTCDTCQKHANLDESDLERDFGSMGARVVLQAVEALNEPSVTIIQNVINGKEVETYRYKQGISVEQVKENIGNRKEELVKKLTQDAYRELIVPLTQQGFLQESSKSAQVNGYSVSKVC